MIRVTAESLWQINCDIREKDDKRLAVNADSKGMCKRTQTCTIKISDFYQLSLDYMLKGDVNLMKKIKKDTNDLKKYQNIVN